MAGKRGSGGNRRDVFVGPHPEGWQVKRPHAERASNVFDTKQEAIDRGRELAKKTDGELVIQRSDGPIGQKDSEGHDPRRTKG